MSLSAFSPATHAQPQPLKHPSQQHRSAPKTQLLAASSAVPDRFLKRHGRRARSGCRRALLRGQWTQRIWWWPSCYRHLISTSRHRSTRSANARLSILLVTGCSFTTSWGLCVRRRFLRFRHHQDAFIIRWLSWHPPQTRSMARLLGLSRSFQATLRSAMKKLPCIDCPRSHQKKSSRPNQRKLFASFVHIWRAFSCRQEHASKSHRSDPCTTSSSTCCMSSGLPVGFFSSCSGKAQVIHKLEESLTS